MMIAIVFMMFLAVTQAKFCVLPCNKMLNPVCGSDGVTYNNECYMRQAACMSEKAILAVHLGHCRDNGRERCLLPCPAIYKPVCGSDGIEYGNECQMRAASCEQRKAIIDVSGAGHCGECKIGCTRELAPVCGSDGKTYGTRCMMKLAACTKKKAIVEVYGGKC